jgi:hypothetical protein
MQMKLEKWALIAEIVSGAAVLITLIFLVLGIRENTDVQRASAYTDLMEGMNRFQTAMLTNSDSIRVWQAFISEDVAGLDDNDLMRLNLSTLTLFRIYESAYISDKYGLLGDSERKRFENNICSMFGRVVSLDLVELVRSAVTEDFMRRIETELCI